jgi:hypothetical protein
LPGVEVISRYYPDIFAPFSNDHSKQSVGIGFSLINETTFPLDILLVNQDRIISERLLDFRPLDPVCPNLAEIVSVPFEHLSLLLYMQCIYTARPVELPETSSRIMTQLFLHPIEHSRRLVRVQPGLRVQP